MLDAGDPRGIDAADRLLVRKVKPAEEPSFTG
jgi:hypothetical protein